MSLTPQIVAAETYHGRKGTPANGFRYSVDYILCDAETGAAGPALFSRNRANLFSLRDRDHGGAPGAGHGAAWVREVLDAQGLDLPGPLYLLTQPRVLGHVFNPVSFWLCHDAAGTLRAVIAEVSNTFGDRHSYLCRHPDLREITGEEMLEAEKLFHVSPFLPIEGAYRFRFDISDQAIDIRIDLKTSEGRLIATLAGARRRLSNRAILWSALRRPFGARRVLALIYWQAIVLRLKGARYRVRPEPPPEELS